MEAVDTSGGTSGRQMMRIVRDEPQPWVFTFAPASAPWGASEPAAASPSSAGDGRPATVEQLMARIDGFVQKALWRDRLETQRELSELVLDGHALYDAQLQRLRAVVKADGADTGG